MTGMSWKVFAVAVLVLLAFPVAYVVATLADEPAPGPPRPELVLITPTAAPPRTEAPSPAPIRTPTGTPSRTPQRTPEADTRGCDDDREDDDDGVVVVRPCPDAIGDDDGDDGAGDGEDDGSGHGDDG
jgi:hypothetical protein